jgi:uncharacterized membrane protein (UPF0127 family)
MVFAQSTSPAQQPGVFETIEILSGGKRHRFQVELADTSEKRARGLMYRRLLPEGQGMLFDFGHDKLIMMWMKNTFLPLDMLFIAGNGRIVNIVRDTRPLSLDIIESGARVRAVLELNAGVTTALGIKTGDHVRHRIFSSGD